MNQQINRINEIIEKLKNKDFNFYFFTMDTKGAPSAAVNTHYMWGKYLQEAGYKPIILHERKDYAKPKEWMGDDYVDLPHNNAEEKNVNIKPEDFILIPEIFSNVMDQTKQLPAKRIVLCQAYDHILEFIKFGESWSSYNIFDAITTTEAQQKYINYLFPEINVDVVNISIPEYFKPSVKPKKPIISIHARDSRNTVKIVKTFFLKYPQFKWVTFRDLKGLNREEFAEALSESCLAVWDDKTSGFGTFPIEAFKTDTVLIGKVPTLIPDWFDEKQAIWVKETLDIPDAIGSYFRAWLEGILPEEIHGQYENFKEKYTQQDEKESVVGLFNLKVQDRIKELETLVQELEKQQTEQLGSDNPEVINLFD